MSTAEATGLLDIGHHAGMHWLAVSEVGVPHGLAWLSERETQRLARMRFTKRRNEYRLRRWAGKRAVTAALGLPTDDGTLAGVELLNRLGGAPYVRLGGHDAPLDVSLTDRAGYAVALVGSAGEVVGGTLGVDLECVEPRSAGFVSDFLTEAERAYVGSRGGPGTTGWDTAANLVWSAKEAALKVLRVGLRADTRSVQVHLEESPRSDGWAALTVDAGRAGVLPGWWRRDGVYLLTIAYRVAQEPPLLLAGGEDLAHGIPSHSWLARPLGD
jgi:4'-phosphopantetheinyl transferase